MDQCDLASIWVTDMRCARRRFNCCQCELNARILIFGTIELSGSPDQDYCMHCFHMPNTCQYQLHFIQLICHCLIRYNISIIQFKFKFIITFHTVLPHCHSLYYHTLFQLFLSVNLLTDSYYINFILKQSKGGNFEIMNSIIMFNSCNLIYISQNIYKHYARRHEPIHLLHATTS